MLIAKIIGFVLFGAILTIPMGVMVGMLTAPFKVSDKAVLAIAATAAYITMGSLVLG